MKPYDWAIEDELNELGLDPFTEADMGYVKAYFDGDPRIVRASDAVRQWKGTPEAQASDVTMIYDEEADPRVWVWGEKWRWPNGAPLVIVKQNGVIIKDGVVQDVG